MNQKLRDQMMELKGMLEAISFPLVWKNEDQSTAYYDLIDSISSRYEDILKQLLGDYCE